MANPQDPANSTSNVDTQQPSTSVTSSARQGTGRRKRWLLWLAGLLVLGTAVYWGSVAYIETVGWAFFNKGRDVVATLSDLAKALQARNFDAVEGLYTADFSGPQLGFSQLKLTDERDGVRIYAFQSTGAMQDRQAARAGWQAYLAAFEVTEEIQLHVHRLEKWQGKGDIIASVRYELIGQPTGEPQTGIDQAYFRMHFDPSAKPFRIRYAELMEGNRTINTRPLFVNVAAEAGVDFTNQFYPEFLKQKLRFGMLRYGPAGITAADYDSDGHEDLFIPDGVDSRLFRNQGDGTFQDVTAQAGLAGLDGVSVGLFADYDNDGDADFFVSRTFKPNQLFRNNGDGTFTDITATAGIGADCCTTVASWADYNNDGWLDLYVGRYLEPRTNIPTTFYARNGLPNQLYRNNGDGTFTNVTEAAGVGEIGLCLGTAFGDYNNDGYPDLFVSNDFGRKTLYRNNRDGTFTDVTVQAGTLAYGAGMSATIGDYDNDGQLDLYTAHIRSEAGWYAEWPTVLRYMSNSWRQGVWRSDMPLYLEIMKQSGFRFVAVFQDMAAGNTLLRNQGDGTFEDVSWATGANPPGWFWGTNLADFDNDGWLDLYAANGWVYNKRGTDIELEFLNHVVSDQKRYKTGYLFDPEYFGERSWHGWERNRLMRNNGDGTFTELGRATNTDLLLNSRGTAVADFWNRGWLDIAVSASTDRHALLRNAVDANRNWLVVKLIGAAGDLENGSNRDAVGARVTLRIGDTQQIREVILGDSYGSQSTLRLHFGLNDAAYVDEMMVRWPRSGREQRFTNVAANGYYEIREGQTALVQKPYGETQP